MTGATADTAKKDATKRIYKILKAVKLNVITSRAAYKVVFV
jgi:hypothetical protein